MMKRLIPGFVACVLLLGYVTQAKAGIIGQALGTAAPPSTLGGFTMTPFAADGSPLFSDVTTLSTPLGGTLTFDAGMNHRQIGSGWATWSHGYTGDVYFSNGRTSGTMTLAPGVGAFDFYAEPNPFQSFTITATDSSGATVTQTVSGSGGASGYGFYTTDSATISSVSISSSVDYAVGEFAVAAAGVTAVPEPASCTMLALGALSMAGYTWRRRKAAAMAA